MSSETHAKEKDARKRAGQSVPGAYLGQSDRVQAPAFTRIELYSSPDGQIEIDALAATLTGPAAVVVVTHWYAMVQVMYPPPPHLLHSSHPEPLHV